MSKNAKRLALAAALLGLWLGFVSIDHWLVGLIVYSIAGWQAGVWIGGAVMRKFPEQPDERD